MQLRFVLAHCLLITVAARAGAQHAEPVLSSVTLPQSVAGYSIVLPHTEGQRGRALQYSAPGKPHIKVLVLDDSRVTAEGRQAERVSKAADNYRELLNKGQSRGEYEKYEVALDGENADSLVKGRFPNRRIVAVLRSGTDVKVAMFYAYQVKSTLLTIEAIVPAEEFRHTDVPVFVRQFVQHLAQE